MSALVAKGLRAKRESKFVDFKRSFDTSSAGEWCELIKDIVAMANSGGGVILVGLDNGGNPTGENVSSVLALDPAVIADKVKKYTGVNFAEIEVHEAQKQTTRIAVVEISAVRIPMAFEKVGTYQVSPSKQRTAFSQGTIYFRHGAKSEPGTTADLRRVIDREVESLRREWLNGVRKVIKAPAGSAVSISQGEVRESTASTAMPIRLVNDPEAPGYRIIDHDRTYPYRQKELIHVVNGMLPDGVSINSHDILAVRRVHEVDDDPMYSHQPKFGSRQYSDAFVGWLVDQHKRDDSFFQQARDEYYAQTHG
jgi:hypothetical protein